MDYYDFLQLLVGVWERGDSATALCPAHDDTRRSLSVRDGGDKVLAFCHAGCSLESITEALGIQMRDLFVGAGEDFEPKELQETYEYCDEAGRHLYSKVRWNGKVFSYRSPDGSWGANGVRRVLYRLPEMVRAVQEGKEIWIVEGEKDVESLLRAGVPATTAGGVNDWKPDFPRYFVGTCVSVVADKDDAGRRSANDIGDSLFGIAERIRIVEARSGKDITDHIEAGLKLEEVLVCKTMHKRDWILFSQKTTGLVTQEQLRTKRFVQNLA